MSSKTRKGSDPVRSVIRTFDVKLFEDAVEELLPISFVSGRNIPESFLALHFESVVTNPSDESIVRMSYAEMKKELQDLKKSKYFKDLETPVSLPTFVYDCIPKRLEYRSTWDLMSYSNGAEVESLLTYFGNTGSGTQMHLDHDCSEGINVMCYGTFTYNHPPYAIWTFYHPKYIVQLSRSGKLRQGDLPLKPQNAAKLIPCLEAPTFDPLVDIVRYSSNPNQGDPEFFHNYKDYISHGAVQLRQDPGDIVYIPPGWIHQVYNYGITMKVAWNVVNPRTSQIYLEKGYDYYCNPSAAFFSRNELYYQPYSNLMFLRRYLEFPLHQPQEVVDMAKESAQYLDNELIEVFMPVDEELDRPKSTVIANGTVCSNCKKIVFLYAFCCNKWTKYRLCQRCYAKDVPMLCTRHNDHCTHEHSLQILYEYSEVLKTVYKVINSGSQANAIWSQRKDPTVRSVESPFGLRAWRRFVDKQE